MSEPRPYVIANDGTVRQLRILKNGVMLYSDHSVVHADLFYDEEGNLVFKGFGKLIFEADEPNFQLKLEEAKKTSELVGKGQAPWINEFCQIQCPPGIVRLYVPEGLS